MDWRALEVSIALALSTLFLLIPLATFLARWLAWSRLRSRIVVGTLVALPLVLPPTVLGFYLLELLGRGSWLGFYYRVIMGNTLAFSFEGLVVASMVFNLPFAVLPLQRAFESVPQNIREAAWVSGLTNWQTFWQIEAPLAWPGFASAIALAFAHSLGEFGVVLMVGGNIPGETRTASIAIYDQVQAFETGNAGRMALLLLVICCLAMIVVNVAGRRSKAGDHGV